MAPAWSSRALCDPTPCRAHRPPWPTSWDCATWPSRSTTCRRLSIGQLPRAMDWSVASASTRALGRWPTSGGRKGSSSRWPSASAEPHNARIWLSARDLIAVQQRLGPAKPDTTAVWARVQERDQDVGEHVAGEQDATVREEDRGVADGVRLMLDDLARHGSAVRGQRGDEPDQLDRDARRALRRHPLPPLPGFTGSVGAGGGGVARHVAE